MSQPDPVSDEESNASVEFARRQMMHRELDILIAMYLQAHPGEKPSQVTALRLMQWNANRMAELQAIGVKHAFRSPLART